jgi:hypothetical protein
MPSGKWWLTKYVKFQYGELSESPKNKVHAAVIRLLKHHGLADRVAYRVESREESRVAPTLKEKEKETEKDSEGVESLGGFADFWERYPRKVKKPDAIRAWKKLRVPFTDGLMAKIRTALDVHKATHEWQKDGGQFIPYPASWLNSRRWEDEVKSSSSVEPYKPQKPTGVFANDIP